MLIKDNLAGRLQNDAHLPHNQISLTELLKEKYPRVSCNDGSNHFFKRKELDYLSQMLNNYEQRVLRLPVI